MLDLAGIPDAGAHADKIMALETRLAAENMTKEDRRDWSKNYNRVETADLATIPVPVQGHFADRDDWCTPEAVDALERTWDAAGVEHETHRYDAAHAFMNDSRPDVYDAKASADAWDKTISFLLRRIC